jgi:hypothetical protein
MENPRSAHALLTITTAALVHCPPCGDPARKCVWLGEKRCSNLPSHFAKNPPVGAVGRPTASRCSLWVKKCAVRMRFHLAARSVVRAFTRSLIEAEGAEARSRPGLKALLHAGDEGQHGLAPEGAIGLKCITTDCTVTRNRNAIP